ncbi:unnamed protein product [Paramecium sonneborni]|uniref:Uncharacterized protein n=1 Tax=Paramecium sonneborni TaxID=65129 RepID=A0A8S1PZ59_9CILI|nr:unnamed protein product [Paramecium sonneborni]
MMDILKFLIIVNNANFHVQNVEFQIIIVLNVQTQIMI